MTGKNADANRGPVALTVNGRRTGAVSRREAMQWVLGAVAASALPTAGALGQEVGRTVTPQENAARQPDPAFPGGYGTDPKLLKVYKPGDVWPLTLSEPQRATARTLADLIIPEDDLGPAASAVGVVEMLDEWISAPYPQQRADRPVVLNGLAWIETESGKRFQKPFAELSTDQHRAICNDICFAPEAKPEFREAAIFFSRFRSLCAAAYYGTPPGWAAIGYVGNTPLVSFDGPPEEVLKRLDVTQTVS